MEHTTNQATTMRKFHWFWHWQDQQEEEWLRAQAREGWHLMKSHAVGFYTFAQGAPADIIYRLDYRDTAKKTRDEYLQLFHDAGWEHVGELNGWQYFRKPAQPGQTTEIFTDVESKIQKYQRLLATFAVRLPIFMLLWVAVRGDQQPAMETTTTILFGAIMILYVVSFFKVSLRIRELKRL